MARKINPPKFGAGETHYLSHKDGAPTRIFIEAVYMKSGSKEWMYCIYSEANNCVATYLPESVLSKRVSKHSGQVYKIPEIMQRYEDGYRFCGNYGRDVAMERGKEFAKNNNIESVMLFPAVDYAGEPINGQYGVWIKWKYVITGNGINEAQDVIRLK